MRTKQVRNMREVTLTSNVCSSRGGIQSMKFLGSFGKFRHRANPGADLMRHPRLETDFGSLLDRC